MQLSKAERIFLDYITEEMDDNNLVTNCLQTRQKFNNLLKKIGQESYSDSTIHRCFSGLSNYHLITKQAGRGLYQVSPIFFFKGTEEQRVKAIRKQLELANKKPINKLRRSLLIGSRISSTPEPEAD